MNKSMDRRESEELIEYVICCHECSNVGEFNQFDRTTWRRKRSSRFTSNKLPLSKYARNYSDF